VIINQNGWYNPKNQTLLRRLPRNKYLPSTLSASLYDGIQALDYEYFATQSSLVAARKINIAEWRDLLLWQGRWNYELFFISSKF